MRYKRTKKKPLSSVPHPTAVSRKVTQSTISSFHTLLKRQAGYKRQLSRSQGEDVAYLKTALVEVDAEIAALGGLSAYQEASRLGQSIERGGDSSKILVEWLQELGLGRQCKRKMPARAELPTRLRLLEIGALSPANYASCSTWIDNRPIDLHSQHVDILQQDFFDRPLPSSDLESFDIVSCSLVLNFVPDAYDRGRMLSLIHAHLKPRATSLLFLVLPLPCTSNSRFMSIASLRNLMAAVGFELVRERWKKDGRLGYWLWQWRDAKPEYRSHWEKRIMEEDGPNRNNFSILLSRDRHIAQSPCQITCP